MNDPVATPAPPATDTLADYFCLPNGDWIIANRQQFWCCRSAPLGGMMFAECLNEPGDPDRTCQMLAGILWAATRTHQEGAATVQTLGTASRQRHLYNLACSYQTTHATPSTMRRVAARLAALGKTQQAAYCETVAEEESGHDELALRDLAALGLKADDFVAHLRPTYALRLVELFQALADGPEPIAVLGYAYALERMALFVTAETLQAVESALPAGVKATRCLRVHSGVGTDVRHVRESQEFIASLPAADRRVIFNGLFEAVTLMAQPVDYPGDAAMDAWATQFSVEAAAGMSPVSL